MKVGICVLASVAIITVSAFAQTQKPGFGDEGCPEHPVFAADVNITDDDFIELHQLPSYSAGPVYTARVYAGGRLVWHGETKVQSVGEASGKVDAMQAKALIAKAREFGFGGLCSEYAMRGFDGGRSVTTLSIGGRVKVVTNAGPSDAPKWLYEINKQVTAFEPVQQLIGLRQDQPQNHE